MAPPLHKAIQDPAAFARAVDAYLSACLVKNDAGKDTSLITLTGLGIAVGVYDKTRWSAWSDRFGELPESDPQHLIAKAIKRCKAMSEYQLQQGAVTDRNSMALALGKCMHGWVEQQHVKVDGAIHGSIAVVTGVSGPDSEGAK